MELEPSGGEQVKKSLEKSDRAEDIVMRLLSLSKDSWRRTGIELEI